MSREEEEEEKNGNSCNMSTKQQKDTNKKYHADDCILCAQLKR